MIKGGTNMTTIIPEKIVDGYINLSANVNYGQERFRDRVKTVFIERYMHYFLRVMFISHNKINQKAYVKLLKEFRIDEDPKYDSCLFCDIEFKKEFIFFLHSEDPRNSYLQQKYVIYYCNICKKIKITYTYGKNEYIIYQNYYE